jgi:hypothetical protein
MAGTRAKPAIRHGRDEGFVAGIFRMFGSGTMASFALHALQFVDVSHRRAAWFFIAGDVARYAVEIVFLVTRLQSAIRQ